MAALGDLRLEERGDFSRDTGQALGGAGIKANPASIPKALPKLGSHEFSQ